MMDNFCDKYSLMYCSFLFNFDYTAVSTLYFKAKININNGPVHRISILVASSSNECLCESPHMGRFARAFAAHIHKL